MSAVNSRQQIAAVQTQRAIVETAAHLFAERGYHATSIAKIAAEAGVAVQTIYNSVGGKSAILARVLDFSVAGERAPVPVAQFMREQAEQEPDPVRIIGQMVEFWTGAMPRSAPVQRMIREAAAVDPEAALLERRRAAQRLRNYGQAASSLDERGALREGLSVDDAAAAIFAIGHPESYRALVVDGDWDDGRWAAWARSALVAALLEP